MVASFYPLYFFASTIGGDQATVENLTPAGAEPHDYELTPKDIVRLSQSQLIIFNGNVEPWVDKIKNSVAGKPVVLVEAAENLATATDPHVWLDPVLAQQEADAVLKGFIQADPAHADEYTRRAQGLKKEFSVLDQEYRTGLAQCQKKDFVTSHAAFGYLASRYQLHQVSIAGISRDEEPSAKALADIAAFVRKNNIQYIFFESLVSPKLSETIANEVGAKTLVLNPIEGLTDEELVAGKNYFTAMRENLVNLRLALECQ